MAIGSTLRVLPTAWSPTVACPSAVVQAGGEPPSSSSALPAPAPVTGQDFVAQALSVLSGIWHAIVGILAGLFGGGKSQTSNGATPSAVQPTPDATGQTPSATPVHSAMPPTAQAVGNEPLAPSPASTTLGAAIHQTSSGQPLILGAGDYSFNNFGSNVAGAAVEGSQTGLDLPAAITGIAGAGVDRTVLLMTPHTSTHAKDIPTTPFTTNQYSLMMVTGSPALHDFTLEATDQGHLYNGLRISQATSARITNVKVTGVPGNDHSPPGETFGINAYRTNGSVYRNIEVAGQGLGAAGFGANSSTNVTLDHGYFHDNRFSAGATFWQTKDITLLDVTSTNNHLGLNFERVSGTVNIVRPLLSGNAEAADISIGNDQGNAVYTIVDPQLPPGQKLRIRCPAMYHGVPNQQQRADIHVIINGVDRTSDVVQWV